MENKTQRLIKIGDEIRFTSVGGECELENGSVYMADYDRVTGDIFLKSTPKLIMPENHYETEKDTKFINKVLAHYNRTNTGTTGVILAGVKGTGKTVMAKSIAKKSDLPIVLLDKKFPPREITGLMTKLKDEKVCIIIDEIDKINDHAYDDDFLLQLFDGISTCGNNLIISTCNNVEDVNEYLLDRCSRIRYYKEFEEMSPSMIQAILENRLNDKTEVKPLTDFVIQNFGLISFDNVTAFAEEVNENPNETFESLFEDMNISDK